MKPTRVPELGPYAQWVAGAVDQLVEISPVMDPIPSLDMHKPMLWDKEPYVTTDNGDRFYVCDLLEMSPDAVMHYMQTGGITTDLDERLRESGYAEYDGPYVKSVQPWNATDRYQRVGQRGEYYRMVESGDASNDELGPYEYRAPADEEGAA